MRPGDQAPGRGGCGANAGAYVLGALSDDEAHAFLVHLDTCAVCRDEVAALQKVADTLALAAPQLPAPSGLRRRVMADVRDEQAKAAGSATIGRRPRLDLGRAARRRGGLVLGGALAAAAAVGVLVLASGGSGGLRTVQASVTSQSGSAVLRVEGGHGELVVRHMPQPAKGKIYEVWLKRGALGPAPTAALFSVSSAGSAAVRVPGDLHGVSEVLVTPEPRGGSAIPTHAPVIVARLS